MSKVEQTFQEQGGDLSGGTATIFSMTLIDKLRKANKVVVFTGAGVSAESHIPTFRDALVGLWVDFNPEDLATVRAFNRDQELVWGWYEWRRMQVLLAQPFLKP